MPESSRRSRIQQVDSSDVEDTVPSPVHSHINDQHAASHPERPKRAARTKQEHKPKRMKNEIEDIERYAYEVIKEMKDIYDEDCRLLREGRGTPTRLRRVEEMALKILKKDGQAACIRFGVLNEVRRWLEPLGDKVLPSQKVKKVLLDLLANLRITKDDLSSSDVGKIVHFYSKNSREGRDVRRMAGNLIRKWKEAVIREEVMEE